MFVLKHWVTPTRMTQVAIIQGKDPPRESNGQIILRVSLDSRHGIESESTPLMWYGCIGKEIG